MTTHRDSRRHQDDEIRRTEGKSLRERLRMQIESDKKKKHEAEKDGVFAATAKLAVSTMTGHVVAQQVAVAAVEGGRAAQAARVASRASMLDYVPGGDYAKLATGQKLSRADSLAMLGQHGGREIAQKNGLSPHEPKRKSAMLSAVAASARKRQEQAQIDTVDDDLPRERGWAKDERRKNQERQAAGATGSGGTGSASEQDALSHPSEKAIKIDETPKQPGTQIEQASEEKTNERGARKGKGEADNSEAVPTKSRMSVEQYEEMKRLEQERDPGPTIRPY